MWVHCSRPESVQLRSATLVDYSFASRSPPGVSDRYRVRVYAIVRAMICTSNVLFAPLASFQSTADHAPLDSIPLPHYTRRRSCGPRLSYSTNSVVGAGYLSRPRLGHQTISTCFRPGLRQSSNQGTAIRIRGRISSWRSFNSYIPSASRYSSAYAVAFLIGERRFHGMSNLQLMKYRPGTSCITTAYSQT